MRSWAFLILARTPVGAVLRRVPRLEATYNERALLRPNPGHRLCGVFPSLRAALRQVPPGRDLGWNNEAAAAIWTDQIDPVRPSSYALFFWLLRLLEPGASILDYGGSIGLSYYGYRRYGALPEGATWTVVELPLIAETGQRIALSQGVDNLFFCSDIGAPDSCDILIASGSLQYMAKSVPGLLGLRRKLPRWLLLNKVPFAAEPFWSLDNIGPLVAPYRVFAEKDFLSYFVERGYSLRDRWRVAEISSEIAFHPSVRVSYHGFCLERRG